MAINFRGISKDDWLTWGAWQFPLLWLIEPHFGWVLAIVCASAVLGTLGGWEHGHKAFRWLAIPLMVCTAIFFLKPCSWLIFLAAPFMIKIAPSYGKNSWLYKFVLKNLVLQQDSKNANFKTRLICFGWYWGIISLTLLFT